MTAGMRSRALRLAFVGLVGVSVVAALSAGPVAAQTSGVYEHVWLAQGVVGGDLGGRMVQAVDASAVTLEPDDAGGWSGVVSYADRIGVVDSTGRAFGQVSGVSLTLSGSDVVAGESAGGTFSGTFTIRTYAVDSPDDVLAAGFPGELDPESTVTYEVTGNWGALLDGADIIGEVLYELAAVPGADMETARRRAAELNRASTMGADALGESQTFAIRGPEPDVDPGDLGETPDPGDSTPPVDGDEPEADERSLLDYIRAGLSNERVSEMPVHAGLATAARALRDARPEGATPLPGSAIAVDIDVSGAYLDAKNRAAGLLDDDGPTTAIPDMVPMWTAAREATVLPVAPADEDAVVYYATRLIESLEAQSALAGSEGLADEVVLVLGRSSLPPAAGRLKTWWHVAMATGRTDPSADVVLPAGDVVGLVLDSEVEQTGPLAEAVLVWAGHETAPMAASRVAAFEPTPSLDASAVVSESTLVGRVLSRHAQAGSPPVLSWSRSGQTRAAGPEMWPAVTSPAGRLLWLTGMPDTSEAALTDGALRGYAFDIERAWLVDAGDMGTVLASYGLE